MQPPPSGNSPRDPNQPTAPGQKPGVPGGSDDAHARARRATAAHIGAAVGKPKMRSGQLLGGVAIGAVLLLAVIFLARENPEAAGTRALEAVDARVINTINGQLANATLEDGTKLRLGPASQLRLAKGFGEKMRVGSIVGTAQFAMPELENPLEIRVGDARVVGNGATVDIRADSGTPAIVRVREGEATVRAAGEERVLAAGDAVVIGSGFPTVAPEAVGEAVGWTDGRFVMSNRPLEYVLTEWRRWYGTALGIGDATILENTVTMDAPLDSSSKALTELEKGGGLRYSWVDKDIMLWRATARR